MNKTLLLLLIISFNINASPINHTHGEKSHRHPLPSQGVKHRHNNGSLGFIKNKIERANSINDFTEEQLARIPKIPRPPRPVPPWYA